MAILCRFLRGADRQLRKDAFKALYDTYGKMKNTIAATFNANVEQACFYADVRNYPSTRAMYLGWKQYSGGSL